MERERTRTGQVQEVGQPELAEGMERTVQEEILAAVDEILGAADLKAVHAETFLQQNQQRGGE
jgi:hypothetical protein